MEELIKMVAAKTGMSESVAKIAVETVMTHLKTKLPSGIGTQIESLLGGKSKGKKANPLDGLTGQLGKLLKKK